jgi:PhnB protein
MPSINPYLNFENKTEEAFNFYKSVFGGEFQTLMRFKDAAGEMPMKPEEGEKIMHMALPIGSNMLMGSDTPEGMGQVTRGTNVSVSVHPDSEEEARRIFNGLAAGGNVTMPFEKAFWGDFFGMLTDKFGINWMVNYSPNGQQ